MNEPEKQTSCGVLLYFVAAILVVGVSVALLLPPLVCRDPRMSCMYNLKAIGLALHNYHDVFGTFPPAYTVDQDDNPLHSWRTLLLPYLEQEVLYKQIKLDEPWDSVHNRQFAEVKLPVYTCPKADGGLSYLAVATAGSLFEGAHASSFTDITDGTSNTIAVIEVNPRTNSWMQSVDFDQRELDQVLAEGLSSLHPGGTQVLVADGSVRFIAATIAHQTFEALLTRAGDEQIDSSDY
jgi:hypothetical protein